MCFSLAWSAWLFLAVDAEPSSMINAQGWAVMLSSITAVLALVGFCLYQVLSLPPVEDEHLKGPLEIDTRDTD